MRSLLVPAAATAACIWLAACSPVSNTSVTPDLSKNLVRAHVAVKHACAPVFTPGVAHCLALVRTDVGFGPNVSGYGPSELQSAYALPSATQGKGQTVFIVDAYDDPNAEGDLGVYRSTFGLPACTTKNGCFEKLNQHGQAGPYPAANSGWALEESLDVDMVSAICPNCHIVLMESNDSIAQSLGKAVDEAVKLGADVVSNSYIGYGQRGSKNEGHYTHAGVIMTAGGGDTGFRIGEPAGFPGVVSVGGTTLVQSSGSRGWSETAWSGTGSGCEGQLAKPSWQTDRGCKGRTMNDVAAVGDPSTGVAFYDTYPSGGWGEVGGTSVATPIVAGVYALAGNAGTLDAAQSLYAKNAPLFDVTSGSDGECHRTYLCTAGRGYDGPTGNGTPNGVGAF